MRLRAPGAVHAGEQGVGWGGGAACARKPAPGRPCPRTHQHRWPAPDQGVPDQPGSRPAGPVPEKPARPNRDPDGVRVAPQQHGEHQNPAAQGRGQALQAPLHLPQRGLPAPDPESRQHTGDGVPEQHPGAARSGRHRDSTGGHEVGVCVVRTHEEHMQPDLGRQHRRDDRAERPLPLPGQQRGTEHGGVGGAEADGPDRHPGRHPVRGGGERHADRGERRSPRHAQNRSARHVGDAPQSIASSV